MPHTLTWVNSTLVVIMTPFNYFLATSLFGRFFNWLTDLVLYGMLHTFRLVGLVRFYADRKKCTIARASVLWEDAERRGIAMEGAEFMGRPIDFYRAKVRGKTLYFNGLPRPKMTDNRALVWMDDKAILKTRLLEAGLPTPQGGGFSDFEKARAFFSTASKPVIVKPRLGSRGRHTTTFIYTEDQLREAFTIAKQLCHWVVVEEHLVGSVYRATMINGRLRGVLGGDPPRVTGDSVKTIAELVTAKNTLKVPPVKDIPITSVTLDFLARRGYTLETVLPAGVTIDMTEKIGVSYGGSSYEITDETHPAIKETLEAAAKVVGDPLLGFDFIIADVAKDPVGQKWGIIECNGVPFINLHHMPLIGKTNNVAQYVWDMIV